MKRLDKCILCDTIENINSDGNIEPSMRTRDKVFLDSSFRVKGKIVKECVAIPTDYAVLNGAAACTYYGHSLSDYLAFRDCGDEKNDCNVGFLNVEETNEFDEVVGQFAIDRMFVNSDGISYRPLMKLDARDVVDAIKNSQASIVFKNTIAGPKPCLKFGEYPQTVVTDETLVDILNNSYIGQISFGTMAKETGKSYLRLDNGYCPEYEYNGEKYVRVVAKCYGGGYTTFDGESYKHGNVYWCKVEPIVWRIENWENLPKEINSDGTGNHLTMLVESDKALISGVAFSKEKTKNGILWQNSNIRAFLNGYDIHEELRYGNGNQTFKANTNYDYKGKGFIADAFGSLEKNQKNEKADEIKKYSRRKKESKYAVRRMDKNLSIDEQIKYYIDHRRSFMLHGKSGIGKSRRIADIDPDYLLLTLRNGMLPEEVIGKECPNPTGEGTKWYPPSWYTELCNKCKKEPDKNHILFIDELTNVNEYEQSLAFHIVLNHKLGTHSGKLPENCIVVAAGNSKDESNSAYNMTDPLFRRFYGHIYIPLDIESVLEWGSEKRKDNPEQTNLHPFISSYLAAYPKCLYSEYDPEKIGKNYAVDPRAWEQLSDIIYDNNGELWEELIENKIGEKNTISLLEFADKNFITLEDILTDNYDEEDIPERLDEQYALALTLRYTSEKDISKVREFISKNLSGETLAKFDFVWTENNPERALIIADLSADLQNISARTIKDAMYLVDPVKYKMHIVEFCGNEEWKDRWVTIKNKERKAISCDTQEKAEYLLKAFRMLRKPLFGGDNYDVKKYTSGENRCYTNWGMYINKDVLGNNEYPVYDFFDIDFAGVLPEDDLQKIEKLRVNEILKNKCVENFIEVL